MRQKHGDSKTRLYRIWKTMKCRCYDHNHPTFVNYGARGIIVCDEWVHDYLSFREWALNHGYEKHLELDRIDVNGGYCPENCQWITHYEQTMNRRDTLYIVIGDRSEKLRNFCMTHGIDINTVNNWRHLGIEEQKIAERVGKPVRIGQRREVITV